MFIDLFAQRAKRSRPPPWYAVTGKGGSLWGFSLLLYPSEPLLSVTRSHSLSGLYPPAFSGSSASRRPCGFRSFLPPQNASASVQRSPARSSPVRPAAPGSGGSPCLPSSYTAAAGTHFKDVLSVPSDFMSTWRQQYVDWGKKGIKLDCKNITITKVTLIKNGN